MDTVENDPIKMAEFLAEHALTIRASLDEIRKISPVVYDRIISRYLVGKNLDWLTNILPQILFLTNGIYVTLSFPFINNPQKADAVYSIRVSQVQPFTNPVPQITRRILDIRKTGTIIEISPEDPRHISALTLDYPYLPFGTRDIHQENGKSSEIFVHMIGN